MDACHPKLLLSQPSQVVSPSQKLTVSIFGPPEKHGSSKGFTGIFS